MSWNQQKYFTNHNNWDKIIFSWQLFHLQGLQYVKLSQMFPYLLSLMKLMLALLATIRTKRKNLNFYFHTSLWYLKRFYEGLKGLHKPFWGTTKKCEKKNFELIFILIQLSEMHGAERIKIEFSSNILPTWVGVRWKPRKMLLIYTV